MDKLKLLKDWSSEAGAELIEFALTFPLLLLVVMGIIDFGLMFHRYEVVTNAAREGARVGVLPGYSPSDAQARAIQYLQGVGLSSATVPLPVPQNVTVSGKCITVVPVTVSYVHTYTFLGGIGNYFGSSFGTKTLTATASMRSESPAGACAAGS
jgi:Flp pilus assembly protein TadG